MFTIQRIRAATPLASTLSRQSFVPSATPVPLVGTPCWRLPHQSPFQQHPAPWPPQHAHSPAAFTQRPSLSLSLFFNSFAPLSCLVTRTPSSAHTKVPSLRVTHNIWTRSHTKTTTESVKPYSPKPSPTTTTSSQDTPIHLVCRGPRAVCQALDTHAFLARQSITLDRLLSRHRMHAPETWFSQSSLSHSSHPKTPRSKTSAVTALAFPQPFSSHSGLRKLSVLVAEHRYLVSGCRPAASNSAPRSVVT